MTQHLDRLRGCDRGSVVTHLPLLLWLVVLAAVALYDVSAYLVAASRAQTLADGAALAVAGAADSRDRVPPTVAARQVAQAGGGTLEDCACTRGGDAEVEVSVPVHTLVVARLGGARRVSAEASARLLPPGDLRPGPFAPVRPPPDSADY